MRARVERFAEPAVLMLLGERPSHGYELLDQLAALTGEERVDMGNLYRALRALEDERIVSSEWRDEEPGPSKRIYELTAAGRGLLDEWVTALGDTRGRIDRFLSRYEQMKEVKDVRA